MNLEGGDDGPPVEEGSPAWMATFGDMMSLLLTFFVLLLSFANMDVIKFSAAVGSLRDAFGSGTMAPGDSQASASQSILDFSGGSPRIQIVETSQGQQESEADLLLRIERMVKAHDLDKLVEAAQTDLGVVLRVQGQLLFDPGSARLRPEALLVLGELGKLVRAAADPVSIEGHTDDEPIHSAEFPSNWHLSADRAIAALEYLVDVAGVDPRRLSAAGHAQMRALVPNDSPENRDRNRRVEFVFLRPETAADRSQAGGGQGG